MKLGFDSLGFDSLRGMLARPGAAAALDSGEFSGIF
jgi:hypothetical protein